MESVGKQGEINGRLWARRWIQDDGVRGSRKCVGLEYARGRRYLGRRAEDPGAVTERAVKPVIGMMT